MCFAEIVSTVIESIPVAKDCAVGLAALTAIYVGIRGLNAWRTEIRGKSEIDLATNMLKSVYRVREALSIVRNPHGYSYERPEHLREKFLLSSEERQEAERFKYDTRWKNLDEAMRQLYENYFDALVMWGEDFAETFVPLRQCINKLSWELFYHKDREEAEQELNSDERIARRGMIYEEPGSEFDQEINEAIETFKGQLLPRLPRGFRRAGLKRKKKDGIE